MHLYIHSFVHSFIHAITICFSCYDSNMLGKNDSWLKTVQFLFPRMSNSRKRQDHLWLSNMEPSGSSHNFDSSDCENGVRSKQATQNVQHITNHLEHLNYIFAMPILCILSKITSKYFFNVLFFFSFLLFCFHQQTTKILWILFFFGKVSQKPLTQFQFIMKRPKASGVGDPEMGPTRGYK